MENFKLFYEIMLEFQRNGLLDKFVLVGSWCLEFYQKDLDDNVFIPSAKTMDADLLIPKVPKIQQKVDIAALLKKHDFIIEHDYRTGMPIFLHPELKVEFLIVLSRGQKGLHSFENFGVVAQELSFMEIPLKYNYVSKYKDLVVKLPEPQAYALHKILIFDRRKNEDKKVKDLESVRGLLQSFKSKQEHLDRLQEICNEFTKKRQKVIIQNAKLNDVDLGILLLSPSS